jgi:non-specific serine/threonine protein kinase
MATTPLPDDPLVAPPVALTPLIGRERELALAVALLGSPEVRLLTLTGPGGIGKSRLSLAVAAEIGSDFADGFRFVALASVPDAGLVATTVARAAGLLDAGDVPVRSTLVAALRHAATLLVLDNFDHVVAAAPLVSDLLASCPRLKILVTSRILLRVDGEHALPVPPLAVPEPGIVASIDSVKQSAAVQLFAQRGEAVSPSFAVADDNAPLVADICRRLDGVPLAIELAAARVNHLSLPMLRERLERRLPLLTGGGRDRPLRLQTMRNAIAWSHDLLSPAEQTLFRRLAVFAGGCTLEAAEWVGGRGSEVGGTADHPSSDFRLPTSDSVLDLIAALVEASLLHTETGPGGQTRYRMLETIREFALERLEASGKEDTAPDLHAAFFADFAARNELAELLPGGDLAPAPTEAEHANLRLTLAWLEKRGEPGAFLRSAASLGHFWSAQGHFQEGRDWLERALAQTSAMTVERAKALVTLGMIEAYQGATHDAVMHLTEALAGCREQGEAFYEANALIGLGALALVQGDHGRGTALLNECLRAAAAVPDQRLAGVAAGWGLINLAAGARTLGDYALAAEQLGTALRLVREAGYTSGMILALGDLGDLARDQGDHARALACYREALDLGRANPRTREVTDVIEAIGNVATAVGKAERAATLLGAADAFRERMGLRFRVVENQTALDRSVTALRAALGEPEFARAWSAGRNLTPEQAVAAALDPFVAPVNLSGLSLTPREIEILRLLATGMTDPAIAAALFVSVRTVENHVARIFAKLGVHTRTAAAAAATASGLIAPSHPTSAEE